MAGSSLVRLHLSEGAQTCLWTHLPAAVSPWSLPSVSKDGVRVVHVWQSEAPPPPLQQQGLVVSAALWEAAALRAAHLFTALSHRVLSLSQSQRSEVRVWQREGRAALCQPPLELSAGVWVPALLWEPHL